MQPRPGQLQMMVELCASSVSISTLNAMLMKAQIACKGPKVQKAKCLVEKLPVHELQKLLAEEMNPPADPAADDTRSSTAAALAADSDARVVAKPTKGYIAKEASFWAFLNPERVERQGGQNQLCETSTEKGIF